MARVLASAAANETTPTIIGTLTADPELRYTSSGLAVVNFTIAFEPSRNTAP